MQDSQRSSLRESGWELRFAREGDIPALEALIPASVRGLQVAYYSSAQMEAALGSVYAVDRQLIRDGTYFAAVAVHSGGLVGCGGWSRRQSLYGGDHGRDGPGVELTPGRDAARVRAFFVHPDWARQGIGRAILAACEDAIRQAGFDRVELVATLAGEPLYASMGYRAATRDEIPLPGGLSLPVVRMARPL